MNRNLHGLIFAAALFAASSASAQDMTFFVTSAGPGDGANLGGLAGADAHCQQLAEAAGSSGQTWRAYLSTDAENARNRIGAGPWHNSSGTLIAESVDALHSDANAISKETALSETGAPINGRGDEPNRHDILTGSMPDGTLPPGRDDATCHGWTSHTTGRAMLGHHNRSGGGQRPTSWNSAHISRGCSQIQLRASMGDGLIYCFAAD